MSELRKHFWVLVLLSFVVFQTIFAENTGSISGKVTSEKSRQGIPDIEISVGSKNTGQEWRVHTDKDGDYLIENLEPGEYNIDLFPVDPPYYFDWEKNSVVHVKVDQQTVFNIKLRLGGSISGKIYNIDGYTPLPGVWVSASDNQKYGYEFSSFTKDDGSFLIGGVCPYKKYKIELIFNYDYSGGHKYKVVDNIVVEKEKETKIEDFFFDVKDETKIEGRVTSSCDEGPIEKARIYIKKITSTGDYIDLVKIYTDANGFFECKCLEPGNYSYDAYVPIVYLIKAKYLNFPPEISRFSDLGKIDVLSGKISYVDVKLNIPSDLSTNFKTNVEIRLKYEAGVDKKPYAILLVGLEQGTPHAVRKEIVENQSIYQINGIPPGKYDMKLYFKENINGKEKEKGSWLEGLKGEEDNIYIPWDYNVIIDAIVSEKKLEVTGKKPKLYYNISSSLLEIIRNRVGKSVYYKVEVIKQWYQE